MNNSWKIARRSHAQLPLVIVVALAIVLVLLGKAQSGLFDRARVHFTDWMAPALETVRQPLADFGRWTGSAGEIFSVYQQNVRLKEENARLRQWRNAAVVLEGRVKRYQALLHAVPDPGVKAMLARVIGRQNKPFLETMILDAGKGDLARPGQAVVDQSGMIGRIYLTGDHTSWVILLTDLNSRLPVTIAPENVQAIMTGDNTLRPQLDTFSRNATIHPGDQVVSSGDGGLVPKGLPIGTVVADGSGWRVALLADASLSQDVEVLNFSRVAEDLPSAPESQLPVIAAGLKPAAPPPPVVAASPPAAIVKPVPAPLKPATPPPPAADGAQ